MTWCTTRLFISLFCRVTKHQRKCWRNRGARPLLSLTCGPHEQCEAVLLRWTYNQSRGGQVAKDLYSGFTGVLQCDGYSGYNNLKGVKRVGYWAHVRRKFYEASHISNTLKACEPLKLLDYMFFLENKWHKLAPKARRRLRHSKMKRLLKQFWRWCDTSDALPKSGFGKAIKYAQDQRPYLNAIRQYSPSTAVITQPSATWKVASWGARTFCSAVCRKAQRSTRFWWPWLRPPKQTPLILWLILALS